MKQKILVVLGPTATGKSSLAVKLAQAFDGEVISADSRQIYRGLDIGTGKITREEMAGIPHHLLDVADPSVRFTVVDWKSFAEQSIVEIAARGKLPIVAGGTGFYISALMDQLEFPDVDIDPDEQRALEARPKEELAKELTGLDPRRAAEIDPHNRRRLARAVLVARELGHVPQLKAAKQAAYDPYFVGLSVTDAELKDRIRQRLSARIDAGMTEEAEKLHANGLSFERMDELGLEYRYLAQYLQNQITKGQMIEILGAKIWQYARRQKTWFRRDKRIHWYESDRLEMIEADVRQFLENRNGSEKKAAP